jgi:hypothetical protein
MKSYKMNSIRIFKGHFPIVFVFVLLIMVSSSVMARQPAASLTLCRFLLSGAAGVIRPPKTLTDPLATNQARSLMSFLVDQYGQKVLSGQQDLSEINYVLSVTGKQPAIGVFDLIEYSPSRIEHGSNPTGQVENWINWANTGGGIVAMSWHWNAPADLIDGEGTEWWRGFYTYATTFDIESVLADPEGERYQLLIRDLDAIAVQLAKFQTAGIPVLWRPLHEASGGWFWWGAHGPEPFIELWRLMYDRYVNVHGLHNLIWVYTIGDADWYPGDTYVDIVGMDIYPNDPDASLAGFWQDTQNLYEGIKLVALSESGIVPDPDKIREYDVWWSWFSVWSGSFIHDVDTAYLTSVYQDQDIITLDELIDWKNYPIYSSPPTCSVSWPLNNIKIHENRDLTINADAEDADGTVTKVEFFQGVTKLGEDTTSPYSYTWTNVPAGDYILSVKATDNMGIATDSDNVTLTAGTVTSLETVRYEAEAAASDGPGISTSYPGYSGTGSRYFNSTGGTGITFTVNTNRAGTYPLTIRYLIPTGWGTKTNDVLVNDVLIFSPVFANTNSAWADYEFGNINLNSGANTIRIQHNWGWFWVDYIQLVLPSANPCPEGDLDMDCDVDTDDLVILSAGWINPYLLEDMAHLSTDWLE